jgi:hypothetical protein
VRALLFVCRVSLVRNSSTRRCLDSVRFSSRSRCLWPLFIFRRPGAQSESSSYYARGGNIAMAQIYPLFTIGPARIVTHGQLGRALQNLNKNICPHLNTAILNIVTGPLLTAEYTTHKVSFLPLNPFYSFAMGDAFYYLCVFNVMSWRSSVSAGVYVAFVPASVLDVSIAC